MADLDEQSAVVSEEVTPEKKVKRARAAAAATNKKAASGKTGAKRVKKPAAKGQEPELNLNSAETLPEPHSNHQTAPEPGTGVTDVKAEPAPAVEQVSVRTARTGDNGRENAQPESAVITEQARPEPNLAGAERHGRQLQDRSTRRSTLRHAQNWHRSRREAARA